MEQKFTLVLTAILCLVVESYAGISALPSNTDNGYCDYGILIPVGEQATDKKKCLVIDCKPGQLVITSCAPMAVRQRPNFICRLIPGNGTFPDCCPHIEECIKIPKKVSSSKPLRSPRRKMTPRSQYITQPDIPLSYHSTSASSIPSTEILRPYKLIATTNTPSSTTIIKYVSSYFSPETRLNIPLSVLTTRSTTLPQYVFSNYSDETQLNISPFLPSTTLPKHVSSPFPPKTGLNMPSSVLATPSTTSPQYVSSNFSSETQLNITPSVPTGFSTTLPHYVSRYFSPETLLRVSNSSHDILQSNISSSHLISISHLEDLSSLPNISFPIVTYQSNLSRTSPDITSVPKAISQSLRSIFPSNNSSTLPAFQLNSSSLS